MSNINAPLLSVAMITFNEERIIEKTLSAIHNWIDQIVVVDSLSTDKTVDILECFNVSLYKEKWKGYSAQKNFAVSKCSGEWILVLDADEVVSSSLKDEILEVIKKPTNYNGFKIKRKFYVGKRWIQYGGYYPDYQLRLFKNNKNAYFKQREVHESIALDEPIGFLNNSIEHYAYDNMKSYKKALKKYALLASKEIKNKKFYAPSLRALWAFIFRYIFRLGFLEGKLGFQLCAAYSQYVYEKYKVASGNKNKK
ncbi:MAG: glycosyltransferase family 2 protein [Candidatus Melainabacteria bacterium]|nr:glycosyltransferase family 2 protein [Candidatus Melainabacteria bacterium]